LTQRKGAPEHYESQLSSALGTIDYMMRNLQGVNYEFLQEVEGLLECEVAYPQMRINVEPLDGFQTRLDQFSQFSERTLRVRLQEEGESRSRASSQADDRLHPLRFSFEEALQQFPRERPSFGHEPAMNPLEEENES
jgi:hypothetical protein